MLFFQNLNLRWFHRDFFPEIQFKNGEVRAPPATRVLVAGSRGGYAHVVNEKYCKNSEIIPFPASAQSPLLHGNDGERGGKKRK